MMLRLCWVFVLLLMCTACASQIGTAKHALEYSLVDKDEVEYQDLESYPGDVVCGMYRAFGRWDSSANIDFRPFLFRHGDVDIRPTPQDRGVFCSDDPAESLYSHFGIDLSATSLNSIEKIRLDYGEILDALEVYHTTNRRYPTTAETLESLVRVQSSSQKPGPNPTGGYIQGVPLDPWNRPYVYTGQGLAGVQGYVKLLTLGADGKVGGKDENADIGNWHFKYIDHVINL
ncbi:MAG: type II secretion system protein GspG [Halioglobus sp.]